MESKAVLPGRILSSVFVGLGLLLLVTKGDDQVRIHLGKEVLALG